MGSSNKESLRRLARLGAAAVETLDKGNFVRINNLHACD